MVLGASERVTAVNVASTLPVRFLGTSSGQDVKRGHRKDRCAEFLREEDARFDIWREQGGQLIMADKEMLEQFGDRILGVM